MPFFHICLSIQENHGGSLGQDTILEPPLSYAELCLRYCYCCLGCLILCRVYIICVFHVCVVCILFAYMSCVHYLYIICVFVYYLLLSLLYLCFAVELRQAAMLSFSSCDKGPHLRMRKPRRGRADNFVLKSESVLPTPGTTWVKRDR